LEVEIKTETIRNSIKEENESAKKLSKRLAVLMVK
jgi:hypothetical protein